MPDASLRGCRILVAEDEYLLADDLSRALARAGAEVAGPVAGVDEAMVIAEGANRIDAAVLDVNLRGGKVFAVADALASRDVPFLFTTGYDRSALPDRFAAHLRLQKPFKPAAVVAELDALLTARQARAARAEPGV